MPKLQMITRTNGTLVYSINLPLEIIESLNWSKSQIINVETNDLNQIILSKEEIIEKEAK